MKTMSRVAGAIGVLAASLLCNGVHGDNNNIIRSCDDFPAADTEFLGTVTFLKSVSCDTPMTIHAQEDVLVRSHATLDTRNVHFAVHEGATLTLEARGAININRDENSVRPLFIILNGTVKMKAKGWIPKHMDGGKADEGNVVLLEKGALESEHAIHYTTNAIMVANTAAMRHELEGGGQEPAFVLQDPILLGKRAAFQAKYGIADNAASNTDGGGGSGNDGVGIDVDAVRTALSSPAAVARPSAWTSRKHGMATATAAVDAAAGNVEASNNPSRATATDNQKYWGRLMGDLATMVDAVINGKAGGCCTSSNPASTAGRLLNVGEATEGPVRSDAGNAEIWLGVDGSIFHRQVRAASSDDGGPPEAPVPEDSVILIRAKYKKVAEVFNRRYEMAEEKRQGGGKERKGRRTWMPWGRRRKAKDAERAKDNAGRVEMTVDNRGGVEVTVDGTCVSKRSGRHAHEWMNKFPWRRHKSNDYTAHATEEGMEVRLKGRTIWSVKSAASE